MTNYTQTNIYKKQMQQLGLNTKQYAELINMPYEVVKDMIYDKEGEYSMEIKKILRKNMFEKHQEIENDIDNVKFKAMELKKQDQVDYLKWYENEYTPELLKAKLNLRSRKAFEDKYRIEINEKEASRWFYTCITGKINYDNHEIRKDVVEQFAEQLYDILVNGNEQNYRRTNARVTESVKHKQKTSILKWFKGFDFNKYINDHEISRTQLAEFCDINYTTLCHLIAKKRKLTYETECMKKVYDYIVNNKIQNKEAEQCISEPPAYRIQSVKPSIELIDNNNELLRQVLVSRLTEEEKMLIKLFGGKIN